MLGLPQCQRCGSEVDYDNHDYNGITIVKQWQKWLQQRDNGVNDQNGFSAKGSRVW